MADILDEELASGLRQARKKPRNFAIIAKGPKILKMFVQKKPLKAGELQKAKGEYKGNVIIRGVCIGDGPEMVFQVADEEPAIKTAIFRAFITEQTELKMKPRWQVVAQLAEVDDNEDESSEAEEEETAASETEDSSAEIPATPPPPQVTQETAEAPPQPGADAGKAILAALNKLSPAIKAAVGANPNRKNDILQPVARVQALVKSGEFNDAKAALLQIGQLLKQLTAGSTQQEMETQPTEAEEVPPTPSPQQQADRGQLLASKWQQTIQQVEPRYHAALKTAPDDVASKLRVMFTYATEQAEAGAYDKALAAMGRLEPLLQQAAASQGVSEEIPEDIVAKRKFMLTRMQEIPRVIRPKLNDLKMAISTAVPAENADELCGAIEDALQTFYDEIQDEVDEAINTGDMRRLRGLKERVAGNELITLLAQNPMTSGSFFRDSLIDALTEIEQNLAS